MEQYNSMLIALDSLEKANKQKKFTEEKQM